MDVKENKITRLAFILALYLKIHNSVSSILMFNNFSDVVHSVLVLSSVVISQVLTINMLVYTRSLIR